MFNQKEYIKKYQKSEKGKKIHAKALKKYSQSEKGKASIEKYQQTDKRKAVQEKYRKTHTKQIHAETILNHAIRAGKIKRQPCEKCGNKKAEAHHENYDEPLKVKWLCKKHHMEIHGRLI